MATFKLKSDLSSADQKELARILAIDSAQRTTVEANFLTARTPYIYNEVILRNASLEIMIAKGRTIPTGDSGFAKGAFFSKEDASTGENSLYQNIGDATTSSWIAVGGRIEAISLSSAQILALKTTPVEVISAKGAGIVTIVDEIFLKNTYGTATYTGSNALEFRYTNASGAKVVADFPSTFLNLVATGYACVKSIVTNFIPVANAPIVACVPTADPAVGDGVITGFVRYHTVTL